MPLDQLTKSKPASRKVKIPPLSSAEIVGIKSGAAPEVVRISRPRLRRATVNIVGISPYVQHAFAAKYREAMEDKQRAGQQSRGKKVRDPKDFDAVYEAAKHYSEQGWLGIPASAFRNAMISACRLVGIVMTRAKLSVWVEADGIDRADGMPLVRIVGEPRVHKMIARNETGVADIRWRPMWTEWGAAVNVTWDEDQFSSTDVFNLMLRAGMQVGIGEGRPDSPNSNGLGWGRFEVKE